MSVEIVGPVAFLGGSGSAVYFSKASAPYGEAVLFQVR